MINLPFEVALGKLKNGARVARRGWNGKGMHVYLEDWLEGKARFGADQRTYEPVLFLYTADRKHQPGWLPSQADLLAEDWQVVT